MFSTTDSSSTLRIGVYLFYIEKITTQFKTTEKNARSPYSFSRKWWFTSMARFSHKENAAIFNARELMMREIMRSRDAQCNTGEWPKVIPLEVPQFKSSWLMIFFLCITWAYLVPLSMALDNAPVCLFRWKFRSRLWRWRNVLFATERMDPWATLANTAFLSSLKREALVRAAPSKNKVYMLLKW